MGLANLYRGTDRRSKWTIFDNVHLTEFQVRLLFKVELIDVPDMSDRPFSNYRGTWGLPSTTSSACCLFAEILVLHGKMS
jgi:hypothetical protein